MWKKKESLKINKFIQINSGPNWVVQPTLKQLSGGGDGYNVHDVCNVFYLIELEYIYMRQSTQ